MSAVVFAVTSATVAGLASPASAAENRDLINKKDGSRWAMHNDSTAEGAQLISLRGPEWKNYRTEVWETKQTTVNGETIQVFRNEASDKCLQPSSPSPERGTTVVAQKCDGSALQKWVLTPEFVNGQKTGWNMRRPMANKNLAITLNRYGDGSWNTIMLDRAYPSDDRLWANEPNNAPGS